MAGIDKIGKPTGPGDGSFLVTDQDVPTSVVFEFILSNYNIDGNILKPEHKAALDEHIVPFLRENKVHAELTGTASRTGAADYNRKLSKERVDRVRQYLLSKGLTDSQVPASDVRAVGEDQSTSKFDEDELERSVRIRIVVGVRPAPVPTLPKVVIPQVVPPQLPATVQTLPEVIIEVDTRVPWAIQELSGFNVGIGAGVSALGVGLGVNAGGVEYHFLLVNSRTRQMSQCRFAGPAVSGGPSLSKPTLKPGFSAGPTFSLTKGSHTWDVFKTPAGIDFSSFEGQATWVEPFGVALNSSISVQAMLTFSGLGITVRVSTGVTIGTPGSAASIGTFHLKPPVQLTL